MFGLHYVGFYVVASASVLKHHGNLIFTETTAQLQQAAALNIKAFVHIGGSLTSAPDKSAALNRALAAWNVQADSIAPYIGSVAAFYLYDEPNGDYLTNLLGSSQAVYHSLQRAAKAVKQRYPDIPVAIADGAGILDPAYRGRPYAVPREIDWVGFDCYSLNFSRCTNGTTDSIPGFLNRLKAAIDTTRQKIFLIPQGGLWVVQRSENDILSSIQQPCPATVSVCRDQGVLATLAKQYKALADANPTVVAIMGFTGSLYEEADIAGASHLYLGALDLPQARDAYDQIFRTIPGNDVAYTRYLTGSRLIPSDTTTIFNGRRRGDKISPGLYVVGAHNEPLVGANVECAGSSGSRLDWRTRVTGTKGVNYAAFVWTLGSNPRQTYSMTCKTPLVPSATVTYYASLYHLIPTNGDNWTAHANTLRTYTPQLQLLEPDGTPVVGVKVTCTPSGDSKLFWNSRISGTSHGPGKVAFAWTLGSAPGRYHLDCNSGPGTPSYRFNAMADGI